MNFPCNLWWLHVPVCQDGVWVWRSVTGQLLVISTHQSVSFFYLLCLLSEVLFSSHSQKSIPWKTMWPVLFFETEFLVLHMLQRDVGVQHHAWLRFRSFFPTANNNAGRCRHQTTSFTASSNTGTSGYTAVSSLLNSFHEKIGRVTRGVFV